MKSNKTFIFIYILLFGLLSSPLLLAQPDASPPPALEKLEQLRKMKLIEVLNLKEEEAIRFFARYKEFRGAEQKLMKERGQLIDDLEQLVKSDAKETDINKKMDEMAEVDKKILNQRWDTARNLRDILSAKQIGTLVIFEQKFMQEVRRALRDAQHERRNGPR